MLGCQAAVTKPAPDPTTLPSLDHTSQIDEISAGVSIVITSTVTSTFNVDDLC